jgi:hypothetical protein
MEQWSKQLGAWLMVRSPHAAPQAASVYPASLYPAPAFPAALRAFFSIMRCWPVRDEDARILLGGVSNGTFYTWKQGTARQLEADRLLRISYLIGIFKALNILFSLELADTWVSLPNTNELFGGRAPLDTMLRGGAPAMDMVRRLLDARRGG